MIHVRPDTRATIPELKSHPWLNGDGGLPDQAFDEELGQSASQLSLDDRQPSEMMIAGASSLREPEPDYSMEFESEKENYTFEQPHAPRLFGEVSATGSSGVIPEERLNLPVSSTSFDETEHDGSEVRDSFEDSEDFSTPREHLHQIQIDLSVIRGPSQPDNSRSALFGIGSQSLGGASSILKNLNMRSHVNGDMGSSSSRISDLASSKRKPAYDTSDEHSSPSANVKPSVKRLKSEGDAGNLNNEEEEEEEEDEYDLCASIPQMIKSNTGRQIDYPLPKKIYWDSQDESTWHLDYPEMTHLQYNAFEQASKRRNEAFEPKKTLLWNIAMKHFPPTHSDNGDSVRARGLRPGELGREESSVGESGDWDLPPTAPLDNLDDQLGSQLDIAALDQNFSSALPPALRSTFQPKTEVGVFKSTLGSLVTGIFISLQDPVLSWGRERGNTIIYQPATESKVPKNAFRVMLWREGYTASAADFRPWEPARPTTNRTMRASPEPDSYAFYIATKATNGIRINGNPLQAHEPKDATAKTTCKHWMKLYNGDQIMFWGSDDARTQAKLIFECSWGGSSVSRPADEPPTCVPAILAQKLDRLWPKAVKSLRLLRIKEEAQIDDQVRMRNMVREQERSRVFEQTRLEAVRVVAERRSREASPANTAPGRARRGPPPVHRFTPPANAR
jgi:hypothetical protein